MCLTALPAGTYNQCWRVRGKAQVAQVFVESKSRISTKQGLADSLSRKADQPNENSSISVL
jgi:hypothetical protein